MKENVSGCFFSEHSMSVCLSVLPVPTFCQKYESLINFKLGGDMTQIRVTGRANLRSKSKVDPLLTKICAKNDFTCCFPVILTFDLQTSNFFSSYSCQGLCFRQIGSFQNFPISRKSGARDGRTNGQCTTLNAASYREGRVIMYSNIRRLALNWLFRSLPQILCFLMFFLHFV